MARQNGDAIRESQRWEDRKMEMQDLERRIAKLEKVAQVMDKAITSAADWQTALEDLMDKTVRLIDMEIRFLLLAALRNHPGLLEKNPGTQELSLLLMEELALAKSGKSGMRH
jgi:type II secretory pathway component PulJ